MPGPVNIFLVVRWRRICRCIPDCLLACCRVCAENHLAARGDCRPCSLASDRFLRGWVLTGFPWLQFGYSQMMAR